MGRYCRRCGRELHEGDLRYEVRVEVKAGVDPLVVNPGDLAEDHAARIRELLQSCEGRSEEDLMRDVYVEFFFDLCPACQREYIKDPLPAGELVH